MILAGITLPNPTLYTVNNAYIVYQNSVIAGTKLTKVLRVPAEGAPYAQKRSLIRMSFDDLTPVEFDQLEDAIRMLESDYNVLNLLGLNIAYPPPSGAIHPHSAWVTLAPGTGLSADLQQGWTVSGVGEMSGPYLITTNVSLITGDSLYSQYGSGE